MHIDSTRIDELATAFKAKYGYELIGDAMTQYHSDFSSDLGDVICSVVQVFLAKKCYIDKLKVKFSAKAVNKSTDLLQYEKDELLAAHKDGDIVYDYHIRMKGIPNQSIVKVANMYGLCPLRVYNELFTGNAIDFQMKFGMMKDKFMRSRNNDKMHRNLQFHKWKINVYTTSFRVQIPQERMTIIFYFLVYTVNK